MKINPVQAILLACLFNALSGVGIFYARQVEPDFSVMAGVSLRIAASLSCFALPLLWGSGLPKLHSWKTGGELWLWGIFGALTLSSYYYAVTLVGAGLTNMVNAGSGLVLTGLAPILTKQKSVRLHQLAALGCAIGMILLCQSALGHFERPVGLVLALLSGIFSALAYLMVARTGSQHSPETVLVHWTIINFIAAGALVLSIDLIWPKNPNTWSILIATGLLMAWSQYFTASAYQKGSASLVACLTFCGPLLSLVFDLSFFGLPLTQGTLIGAALILTFGLIVPLKTRHN
jgi:drug/metabolite transporter (DMT)-like permease